MESTATKATTMPVSAPLESRTGRPSTRDGISPVFDIPSLVLGRPVRDSSGALTGIVVAFVAVDSIRQAFSSLLLDGHQVMVSLPNGKDLVRIPQEHPHILDGMDSGLAKMMAAGEGILDADDGFGHPWIVAMHHSSPGGMDLAYATLAAKAKPSKASRPGAGSATCCTWWWPWPPSCQAHSPALRCW